jgi:hypothetical protein
VIGNCETQPGSDLPLAFLDLLVGKFFDPPAIHADDVVVVHALVHLENRRAAFETVAGDNARGLELRQHAVHSREPDILLPLEEPAINVFRTHMPLLIIGQDFEYLYPRSGDLESCFT